MSHTTWKNGRLHFGFLIKTGLNTICYDFTSWQISAVSKTTASLFDFSWVPLLTAPVSKVTSTTTFSLQPENIFDLSNTFLVKTCVWIKHLQKASSKSFPFWMRHMMKAEKLKHRDNELPQFYNTVISKGVQSECA